MWTFSFFLVITFGIVIAKDVVVLQGKCDNLSVQGNMKWLEFFNDTWFEIQRYPTSGSEVHCVDINAIKKNNTAYTLNLNGKDNGQKVHHSAEVILSGETHGIFEIDKRKISILQTDPESYAVLHECVYNSTSMKKTIHNWIFSRDFYLKAEDMEQVTEVYKDQPSLELRLNLHEAVLQWGDTCSGCAFNSALLSLILACVVFVGIF